MNNIIQFTNWIDDGIIAQVKLIIRGKGSIYKTTFSTLLWFSAILLCCLWVTTAGGHNANNYIRIISSYQQHVQLSTQPLKNRKTDKICCTASSLLAHCVSTPQLTWPKPQQNQVSHNENSFNNLNRSQILPNHRPHTIRSIWLLFN